MDSVKQFAEQRHQEVVKGLTSIAQENHRSEMAQVEGEASRTLHEQGVIHASAEAAFKREAANNHGYLANYVNAKLRPTARR